MRAVEVVDADRAGAVEDDASGQRMCADRQVGGALGRDGTEQLPRVVAASSGDRDGCRPQAEQAFLLDAPVVRVAQRVEVLETARRYNSPVSQLRAKDCPPPGASMLRASASREVPESALHRHTVLEVALDALGPF